MKIHKLNERITKEMGKMRLEMEGLRVKVHKSKAEIIKWMFIFWMGQIAVLSGIMFAIIRK